MLTLMLERGAAMIQIKARGATFTGGECFYFTVTAQQRGEGAASDLDIVLQASDQLPVHLSRLSHSDAAALGLAEAVLKDAAGFVGLLQLQPQLLQLEHLLLLEHVAHLQHLTAKLLHLILGKEKRKTQQNIWC